MKFVARFVHILLWLKVAASPVLLGAFIGGMICFALNEMVFPVIAICIGLGAVLGIIWAEKTRRTVGLSKFHGRLIGHPEIDGSKSK
ncbi:hypothetical protein [Photobacterium sp. OFAV2-7]|uniref:hypothetical protein n=1 Tax=Photobacterium sp. OFAV2-7 TaxID=2917748 RepID=UPI001EF62261|nr:hypothetical protein [Photobacterium sp. OFAV2-7]MCG7588115.1 hypothetical protein [Photobacterium sp. OFAV2-7]